MPIKETFVTRLLRAYHAPVAIAPEQFDPPTQRQVNYLCAVGLGPTAFRVYGDLVQASDPCVYSVLLSADLTTRAIYKQMNDATVEIVKGLSNVGITPVLLKGISVAYEFYSPHHLRLMGDVDILVKPSETDITMMKLAELGYEVADEHWVKYRKKAHHHLPEARNPNTGVTVEVHTSLFLPGGPFAKQPLFQADSIASQTVEFDYEGTLARRFTPEFQFVYTIAHWAVDGNWAINLTSINDTVHILRRYGSELDWTTLADWIDVNPWVYPNIVTMTDYLDRAGIIDKPARLREALASSNNYLGRRTSKILAWLLHNYPFNAREKTRDGYARWRGQAIWQEMSRPDNRDTRIPYSLLRTAARSVHHGKYNPLGWIVSVVNRFMGRGAG